MNNIDFSKVITPADRLRSEYKQIEAGVDAWLDTTVKARGYGSMTSCVSYAGDPDPAFDLEGTAARAWRSAVYRRLYELQDEQPVGIHTLSQIIPLLPQPQDFGWPMEPLDEEAAS